MEAVAVFTALLACITFEYVVFVTKILLPTVSSLNTVNVNVFELFKTNKSFVVVFNETVKLLANDALPTTDNVFPSVVAPVTLIVPPTVALFDTARPKPGA